jgi:spoIIIJ-associated protein
MSQQQQMIEEQAPTVEEAVEAGLARLGLPKERVNIEVVDEGRRGLLGIGGRDAIVRLRPLPKSAPAPEQPAPAPKQPAPAPKPSAPAPRQPAPAPRPEPPRQSAPPPQKAAPEKERDTEADDAAEVETAKRVVEQMLDHMQVVASVEVTESEPDDLTNRRVTVLNITGEDLGLLIGARGETLDAIQHLARLMVGHQMRRRTYFVIDVEGYRARREQALARLAERMGQKAVDRGKPVTLEAMPSYERRIIHMTLRENPQVRTESTGEGDRRRVRIYPL